METKVYIVKTGAKEKVFLSYRKARNELEEYNRQRRPGQAPGTIREVPADTETSA